MNIRDSIDSLPMYLRTTAELSQATGYTSLGMLRESQNKALLARNAALCETLRLIGVECLYLDCGDESAMKLVAAVLAACEVEP